jgi:hypothetical protein
MLISTPISSNVTSCFFSAMGSDAYVRARAMTSASPMRTCEFVFSRGGGPITCTISMADGLPVELLDFAVEDEGGEETGPPEEAGEERSAAGELADSSSPDE